MSRRSRSYLPDQRCLSSGAWISCTVIATSILIICGVLLAASTTRAHDEDTKCSNRTLQGDYGFASEGVLLGVPGFPPEAQFRSVGMAHFDGKGNLTWVEHTVENGTPLNRDWISASGTYTINSNCTGTAVVSTPNSPVPLNLAFVTVKQGKEIHSILDSNAIATVFTKAD